MAPTREAPSATLDARTPEQPQPEAVPAGQAVEGEPGAAEPAVQPEPSLSTPVRSWQSGNGRGEGDRGEDGA